MPIVDGSLSVHIEPLSKTYYCSSSSMERGLLVLGSQKCTTPLCGVEITIFATRGLVILGGRASPSS